VDEAIEQFRNAVSVSHRMQHRLALGLALAEAGQLDEAAIYLQEVLRENANDGPAHLGMARIEVRKGDFARAASHYQSAIDGAWPDNPQQHREQARREMTEALASRPSR
jgi:Tfp pilus assembly protein PilF